MSNAIGGTLVSDNRPHVVIVGGGFGGLYAARTLAKHPVRITVVDRSNHHVFQPLLYQVASAALSPGDIAQPIRGILRKYPNVRVLLGEVMGVDLERRQVQLDDGALDYDYLILATGARHGYFGHDEWEHLAPGLKSIEDALEIRRRILAAYEAAEREAIAAANGGWPADEAAIRAALTFVVVGGGPTGVELAGAIAEIARHTLARDFRAIDPGSTRVLLIESGPRILNTFPESLTRKAQTQLERIGVEVRTGAAVTNVTQDAVYIGDEVIPTRTILWAAGVSPSALGRKLGVPIGRGGRVQVEPDLTVPGHPEVYVIGDLALFDHGLKQPLPGVAPVAMQMGQAAADNIARTIAGEPRKKFKYVDKGRLAIIGRGAGIADFGKVRFSGRLAWLAWLGVHVLYLIGFEHRLLVMLQWAWSYLTYSRGARLITGARPIHHVPALARDIEREVATTGRR
jgi:NADH dehydrogenase